MGVGGQRHAPVALPPGMTRNPLYGRLGGPQSRSGWVQKISSPAGFDPQSIQYVASHHSDWAIRGENLKARKYFGDLKEIECDSV